jgi:hypothetical protein
MTPAIDTLRRLISMLETVRPAGPSFLLIDTEAGQYTIGYPDALIGRNVWTWSHDAAERYGTGRTLYDCLDEIMGDIDWNTCQSCHATHEVEGNGKFCADCLAEMGEAQADAEADAADNRLDAIREAGL